MPKLENFPNYIKVDDNPFAKNGLIYQVDENNVSVYYANKNDQRLVDKAWGRFDQWTLMGVAYTSVGALTDDLDAFIFQSDSSILGQMKVGHFEVTCLLKEIKEELKILNLHQQEIKGECLTNE